MTDQVTETPEQTKKPRFTDKQKKIGFVSSIVIGGAILALIVTDKFSKNASDDAQVDETPES